MANPSEPTTGVRLRLLGRSSPVFRRVRRIGTRRSGWRCAPTSMKAGWKDSAGLCTRFAQAKSAFGKTTTSQVEIATDFHILVAVKSETATDNPFLLQDGGETGRSTVLNRVIRDVIQRLLTDPTLGGIAINVMHETARVDREFFLMGDWLCAEITTTVLTLPPRRASS